MEIILTIFIVLVGIAVGTSLPWWVGGIIVVIGFMSAAGTEGLGAIIPYIMTMIFLVGLVIGNFSYAIQTDSFSKANISNPFVVEKAEKIQK